MMPPTVRPHPHLLSRTPVLTKEGEVEFTDPAQEAASAAADQSAERMIRADADEAVKNAGADKDIADSYLSHFMPNMVERQRMTSEAIEAAPGVAGQVLKAAPTELIGVFRSALRGVASGVENAINAFGELDAMLPDINPLTRSKVDEWVRGELEKGVVELPKPEAAETTTGPAVEAITQFLVGFLPAMKGIKAINALGKVGPFASEAVASGLAGFFTMTPEQENITAALVEAFPELEGPFTDYLATAEDDPEILNRLRNATEESIAGPLGLAVFHGLRAVKGMLGAVGRTKLKQGGAELEIPFNAEDYKIKFGDDSIDAPMVTLSDETERAAEKLLESRKIVFPTETARKFTPEELDEAREFYKQPGGGKFAKGYWDMNQALRKIVHHNYSAEDAATEHGLDVPDFDAFVNMVQRLDVLTTKDTAPAGTVWRGGHIFDKDWLINAEKGNPFHDGAFTSTSQDAIVTHQFYENAIENGMKPNQMAVYMEIEVPPGVPAGFFKDFESEVLLPRGTSFEFIDFDPAGIVPGRGAGLPVVRARILPGVKHKGPDFIDLMNASGTDDFVVNINMSKINTSDDIKQVIRRTGEALREKFEGIQAARIPEEELNKLADTTGAPVSKLKELYGETLPDEVHALRTLLVSSAKLLLDKTQKALQSSDPADMVAFRKAFAVHSAIQAEVVGQAARAGRLLQSFQIPVNDNKSIAKELDRILLQHGGADANREIAKRVSQLTPAELSRASNLKNIEGPWAKARDVFYEWWINGLLSGPSTHVVNTVSNAATAVWSIPENALAIGLEEGLAAGATTAGARIFGMAMGFKDGLKLMHYAFTREGLSPAITSKIDITRVSEAIVTDNTNWLGQAVNAFGSIVRIPGRALIAEDILFKSIGYRMKLYQEASLRATQSGFRGRQWAEEVHRIVSDPPDELRLAAIDEADYLTFTRPAGPIGQALMRARNAVPLLKLMFPFVNTPANILKYTFERTPLAPLMKDYRAAVRAGGMEASKARTKMAMGSMAMMAFADFSAQDLITGSGPVDPDLRRVWLLDHQPYSIRVGDKWLRYSRLDPVGFLMGFSADFAQIAGYLDDNEAGEVVGAAALALASNFTDKTYLSGLSTLTEFLSSSRVAPGLDQAMLINSMQRLGSTIFIPRIAAQAEQAMDPTVRAVSDMLTQLQSEAPGWSDQLPAEHNIWGEPILLSHGMGPDNVAPIYNFISPFRTKDVTDDPVNAMLVENKIGVSMPQRSLSGVDLTEEQYQFLVVARGTKAKAAIEKTMKQVDFRTAPRHIKEVMIRRIFTQTSEIARAELLAAFPDLIQRITQKKLFDVDLEPTEAERTQ